MPDSQTKGKCEKCGKVRVLILPRELCVPCAEKLLAKMTSRDYTVLVKVDGAYHEVTVKRDHKGRLIVGRDLGIARWVP